jgi:hypothetical protein
MTFDRSLATIAAVEMLLADAGFQALIGTDVGADEPGGLYESGWVFPGVSSTGRPLRDPTGQGTSAVTLDMWGDTWSPPNAHNTLEFPTLRAIVWSDPTRPTDDNGLIAVRDAEARCGRVKSEISRVLNDTLGVNHDWPNGVRVGSCILGTETPLRDVPPYDGLVAGELRFHVEAA